MAKLADMNEKIEKTVVGGYKKIEESVVGGYKKIEEGAVNGYKKVEDAFVDTFFAKEGETTEEAKARLQGKKVASEENEEAADELKEAPEDAFEEQ